MSGAQVQTPAAMRPSQPSQPSQPPSQAPFMSGAQTPTQQLQPSQPSQPSQPPSQAPLMSGAQTPTQQLRPSQPSRPPSQAPFMSGAQTPTQQLQPSQPSQPPSQAPLSSLTTTQPPLVGADCTRSGTKQTQHGPTGRSSVASYQDTSLSRTTAPAAHNPTYNVPVIVSASAILIAMLCYYCFAGFAISS
jgi:hypothetical protein